MDSAVVVATDLAVAAMVLLTVLPAIRAALVLSVGPAQVQASQPVRFLPDHPSVDHSRLAASTAVSIILARACAFGRTDTVVVATDTAVGGVTDTPTLVAESIPTGGGIPGRTIKTSKTRLVWPMR